MVKLDIRGAIEKFCQLNRILMGCCPDTTQHSVACLISLSSWIGTSSLDDEIDSNSYKSLGDRSGE